MTLRSRVGTLFAAVGIATVLLIAATAAPKWKSVSGGGVTISFGLWQVCASNSENGRSDCQAYDMDSLTDDQASKLRMAQIFSVVAVVSGGLASILTLIAVCKSSLTKCMRYWLISLVLDTLAAATVVIILFFAYLNDYFGGDIDACVYLNIIGQVLSFIGVMVAICGTVPSENVAVLSYYVPVNDAASGYAPPQQYQPCLLYTSPSPRD